jgi:hypothetical protein
MGPLAGFSQPIRVQLWASIALNEGPLPFVR